MLRPHAGLVFRRHIPSASAEEFSRPSFSQGLHPGYGAGGGRGACGGLNNMDGVRCWMPCIDSPAARTVFDVTISVINPLSSSSPLRDEYDAHARALTIISSGMAVPCVHDHTTRAALCPEGYPVVKMSRTVTVHRIAPSSLGVFVGRVSSYRLPVYGTAGFLLIESTEAPSHVFPSSGHNLPVGFENAYLGIDLATKYLQRSVGKRYQHRTYFQV